MTWESLDEEVRASITDLAGFAKVPLDEVRGRFLDRANKTKGTAVARVSAGWTALKEAYRGAVDWGAWIVFHRKQKQVREEMRRNPWAGRPGWQSEDPIPIKTEPRKGSGGKVEEVPVEEGYPIYNALVGEAYYRPFRDKTTGEARVAVPTPFGLAVLDAGDPGLAEWIGYRHYALGGLAVPSRGLATVVMLLRQRALARNLPRERIVDLAIRFATVSPGVTLLDLHDYEHRCVRIGAEGWTIERVGHPIFDAPSHLVELPEPVAPANMAEALEWYRLLFRFANVPGEDTQLLMLAIHVQNLIEPSSAKPVTVITGPEGAAKTSTAEKLQQTIDPSAVRSLPPPEKPPEIADLAYNRATISFDNLSHISAWLSDTLARLCTGGGLAKREHYSNRGEVLARRLLWILLNGITSSPQLADLIRRCVFIDVVRPAKVIDTAQLDRDWEASHPRILGGLLMIASGTVTQLRDSPPDAGEESMASYVRIGRAVTAAIGRPAGDFDRAWRSNVDRQGVAAAENPWVGVLYDYFSALAEGEGVGPGVISKQISESHREVFPKGVTSQMVGIEIARCTTTLENLGLRIHRRVLHGSPLYSRKTKETASPASPLETFSEVETGVRLGVRLGCGSEEASPREGEADEAASPSPTPALLADSLRRNDGRGEAGEAGEATFKVSGKPRVGEKTARSAFTESAKEEGIDL